MKRARPGPFVAGLVYTVLLVAPLGLATVERIPGSGFAVNFSIGLGFIGLAVLGLQVAAGARLPWMSRRVGSDATRRFHREITLLAVVATLGHPVVLFAVGGEYRTLLDVLHDPVPAKLGWLSTAALVLLIATSIWRRTLRLSYPVWHVVHTLLSTAVVVTAMCHAFLVGDYMHDTVVRATWLGYGALFLWLAVYVRLIRPVLLWRHPWVVTGLHPEPGNAVTITVQPRSRRHGLRRLHRFQPGQFAWLLIGGNPFSLRYHPFSLSSSSEARRELEFTIKRVGQFTSMVRALRIGDSVYLDGPHGDFTIDRTPGPGFVFLAAGVGVTPILSMLATLADRREKRPCLLLLGNRYEGGIVGVRQLHGLAKRLNLTVVHVISRPSLTWSGERGRITSDLLRFYLPANYRDLEFFLCASPQTATAYRRALADLNVPASHVHSEQF
jgi:predicted ferric reductase